MVAISTIGTFDLVVGTIAGLGLLYLLYSETVVVHYARFFRIITLGLLVYAITGPIVGTFAPALIHAIHGLATLFIAIGLYDLVRGDITPEDDYAAILGVEAPPVEPEAPE